MEPTQTYGKTKRNTLIFASALLLAVYAGFKIDEKNNASSVLPFELSRPELLHIILFFATLFTTFQLFVQWAAQLSEIQSNRFYRIDFRSTIIVSIASILSFTFWFFKDSHGRDIIVAYIPQDYSYLVLVIIIISVGVILSILILSGVLEKQLNSLGRRWKATVDTDIEGLAGRLRTGRWRLIFNPETKKSKEIEFLEDGAIGSGRNSNEWSWRISNGMLEILDPEDNVYSRFYYDERLNEFEHTNDPDTQSIRSQRIVSIPQ